jgi:hypothetical protein
MYTSSLRIATSSPLADYLADVYGGDIALHDDVASAFSNFNWLYWSATPAFAANKASIRIWIFSEEYLQQRASSHDSWQGAGVLDDMGVGDGALHLSPDLGFFRWAQPEPAAALSEADGRRWMEVLRYGLGGNATKEDDIGGVWYYALHGSGFWLDLGRELDTTCDPRTVVGDGLHAVLRPREPHAPSKAHEPHQAAPVPVSIHCSRTSSSSSSGGGGGGGSNSSHTHAPARCQLAECRGRASCRSQATAAAQPGRAAHSTPPPSPPPLDLCIPGLEMERPAMLRSPIVTSPWVMGRAFDSVIKWSPQLFHWWRRASPKEVVDLRSYGTPRCSTVWSTIENHTANPRCANQPAFLPCGGWHPQRNASTLNVRTGWRARGSRCSGCTNDREGLNCGPHAPPARAAGKSATIFRDGWSQDPVQGACLRFPTFGKHGRITNRTARASAAEYTLVNHTAVSPKAFVELVQRQCLWAYFRWP